MRGNLTEGPITSTLLKFAVPMILGNVFQQLYNIADTLIVGRFIGSNALAAVGSSYSLMTFITSVLIGLCMGSGALFSIAFGEKDLCKLRKNLAMSLISIFTVTIVMSITVFIFIDEILYFLQTPVEIYGMMRDYLWIIFFGIVFIFIYNYYSFALRAVGNSVIPFYFLILSTLTNIFLDLLFIITFDMGVKGAALATVIAQVISGLGIMLYTLKNEKILHLQKKDFTFDFVLVKEIMQYSFLTCLQQSVMNFGILMVQGLVNSFGTAVMAAFAAAVKIDTLAYMPAQEFGNAFSLFVSQNYGAGKKERIKQGIKSAIFTSAVFCIVISFLVFIFAQPLMKIFIDQSERTIIAIGVDYLRIEGAFYCGIGCLFLLYGYYRAVQRPEISLILTIISLGTRVLLAYMLSAIPAIGVSGIWWSIPIGWILADFVGIALYGKISKKLIN